MSDIVALDMGVNEIVSLKNTCKTSIMKHGEEIFFLEGRNKCYESKN